ncbi:membrane protein [Nocardiopsis ansamitocini]|uniref:Membrane protein n=1 Tax=Nocardiopsis ansamitocini TaxID=1670832 RepID=A0A9W6P7T7_9ACTN|nr:membrane protein [Nocardiopsis ansamitocini]
MRTGTLLAGAGVLAFSLNFPATTWSLGSFGPWTTAALRCVIAGLLAGGCLLAAGARVPARRHWPGLLVVAVGCVLGFPLLSTLALETTRTSHAAVVIGGLPIATAVVSCLRTGQRPSPVFWGAAVAGAATVVGFVLLEGGGSLTAGDGYLLAALVVCAAGYAEGGRLARHLPGWQVIAWALVAALPLTTLVSTVALTAEPVHPAWTGVAGMAYLAVVTQFVAFVLWYGGMGVIGVAKASQLQLAQPLLTLLWAVALLGERLTPAAPAAAAAVLACIVITQRARG